MDLDYRNSVIGVFTNSDGLVLVGERRDHPGNWQLPQGGIEPGESAVLAFYREMEEETGCGSFSVVTTGARPTRYDFPPGLNRPITRRYRGQSLQWFHARYAEGAGPDPARTDGEFRNFRWVPWTDVVGGIVDWKKAVYEEGFALLGFKTP